METGRLSSTVPSAAPRGAPGRRFGALRHRNFRLLWLGLLTSNIGTWMQTVAQGWLVYALTNSTVYLGLVGLCRAVPMVFFPLFGGVLADRVDRIRLLFVTQSGAAALAFLLAFLVHSGWVTVWHILAIAFLSALLLAFDQPTRQALLPDLVTPEDLLSATSLNAAVFNGAAFVGPALAGLLVPVIGLAGVFYLNALSFGAVILALVLMRVPERRRVPTGGLWQSFREGLAYVARNDLLRLLIVLAAATSFFGRSYQQLMPAFARDVLHTDITGLGFLLSAPGAGTLLGAFGLAALHRPPRKDHLLLGSVFGFALLLSGLALCRLFLLAVGLLFLLGVCNAILGAATQTLLQLNAPGALRGRVMSLYTICFLGFTPLGSLFSGALAAVIGIPEALAVGAGVVILSALVVLATGRPALAARGA